MELNEFSNEVNSWSLDRVLSMFEKKQELSRLLGLRQMSQLKKVSEHKIDSLTYMMSRFSKKAVAYQVNVGSGFIFGDLSTTFASEDEFNIALSRCCVSELQAFLAKEVLLYGKTAGKLSLSSLEAQQLEQTCISICRSSDTTKIKLFNTLDLAIENLKGHSVDPVAVISILSGESTGHIVNFMNRKETPSYSQAAFYSIIANLPSNAVSDLVKAIQDSMDEFTLLVKKFNLTFSEVKRLIPEVSKTIYSGLRQVNSIKTMPTLRETISIGMKSRELRASNNELVYPHNAAPFFVDRIVFNFELVSEKIKNGQVLYEMGLIVSKVTGSSSSAIHKSYQRYKEKYFSKNNGIKSWWHNESAITI
jgi:hypothetical protein